MKGLCVVLAVALASAVGGCGTTIVSQLSDDDLAKYVELGAEKAAKYGLKAALEKNPADAAAIAANVGIGVDTINQVVLPLFQGSGTGEVLRSGVDLALQKLDEKVSPTVKLAIQLALNVVAGQVKLPANPTDKLDDRTKKALTALFRGLATGLKDATMAAREIGPPKLSWPTK